MSVIFELFTKWPLMNCLVLYNNSKVSSAAYALRVVSNSTGLIIKKNNSRFFTSAYEILIDILGRLKNYKILHQSNF